MSEWTVEELDGCAVLNRHDGSMPMQFTYISGINEIVDAHNTALAAERKKREREMADYETLCNDLRHQRSAEREKATLATQMAQIESKRANEAEQKVQTLVELLVEARPIVFNAKHEPSAAPWQKDIRGKILDKIDAQLAKVKERK